MVILDSWIKSIIDDFKNIFNMYQVNLDVEREKFEVRLLLNMERIFVVKDGFIVRIKKMVE